MLLPDELNSAAVAELPGAGGRSYEAVDVRAVKQWLELEVQRLGLQLEEFPAESVRRIHYDTDGRHFHRAGLSLQLRVSADVVDAVLEPLQPVTGARESVTQRLAGLDPTLLASATGVVGDRVQAIAGPSSLAELFASETLQQRLSIAGANGRLADLVLQETIIQRPHAELPTRIARVHVADLDSAALGAEFLGTMEATCGLRPTSASTHAATLVALGSMPLSPQDLGPIAISSHSTAGEVAFAVLRRELAALLAHEPGTRLGENVEELHDMRVAIRRMRAALRLYISLLPQHVVGLDRELRWLARSLGEVRDLDVHLVQLVAWRQELDVGDAAGLAGLETSLRQRRQRARRRMLVALDSRRYERLVVRMSRLFKRGPVRRAAPAQAPILVIAPQLILERVDGFLRRGSRIDAGSDPSAYHRLRIKCKGLRYALEFHREVYGKPIDRMIRPLVKLQDLLGQHQDAEVVGAWLHGLVRAPDRRLPVEVGFVAGVLAERSRRRAAKLRRDFPRRYDELSHKRWKALRRRMESLAAPTGRDIPCASTSSATASPSTARIRTPRRRPSGS